MRILFLCVSLFLVSSLAFSQSSLPESKVSLGIGMGPSYGIFGVKAIVGKDNSGLVLGFSPLGGYSLGVQGTMNSFYFNYNYGTALALKINDAPVQLLKGTTVFFGKMFNLGATKNTYIDFSVGHSFGVPKTFIFDRGYNNNGFTFNLGIGFRISKSNPSVKP